MSEGDWVSNEHILPENILCLLEMDGDSGTKMSFKEDKWKVRACDRVWICRQLQL